MSARSAGAGGGILLPLLVFWLIFAGMGGGGIGAVDSEVNATATVIETEYHEGSVEATVEVTNTDYEAGTVGLHVHYWSGECSKDGGSLKHSHGPSTHVEAGETVTITDTFSSGDPSNIDCVSAHVHD